MLSLQLLCPCLVVMHGGVETLQWCALLCKGLDLLIKALLLVLCTVCWKGNRIWLGFQVYVGKARSSARRFAFFMSARNVIFYVQYIVPSDEVVGSFKFST